MGTDAHVFLEVKLNGVWHLHSHPITPRNYRLFGIMAGVRDNSVDPVCEPKGLPDDLSVVTQYYVKYWEGDFHTASWFTVDELNHLFRKCEDAELISASSISFNWLGYVFGNDCNSMKYQELAEDIRLVFWFDN